MRKFVLTMAAALLMVAPAAYAASVAGKWSGEAQGRNGPQPIALELKETGGKLSGTLQQGQNGPVDIEEGTVAGNAVTFNVTRQVQGYDLKIKYAGELKGDELTLNREMQLPAGAPQGNGQAPAPITLRRSK